MTRAMRPKSIGIIARRRAEDAVWGIPESPEFSSVQRLMNEIQSQTMHEEEWLSKYRDLAKESTDPLIRFLAGLIVADEERHHELASRMISKLKNELASSRPAEPARRAGERRKRAEQWLRSVEVFLEAERKAIKEYEKLKKESEGLSRDVFSLLYATMIHDSHKHVGILEFMRARLRVSRRLKD